MLKAKSAKPRILTPYGLQSPRLGTKQHQPQDYISSLLDQLVGPNQYLKKEGHLVSRSTKSDYSKYGIRMNFNELSIENFSSAILAKTDKAWWQKFVSKVNRAVEDIINRGFVRIMMRDSKLIKRVEEKVEKGKLSPSGAWIEILNNPSQYSEILQWPPYLHKNVKYSEASIRKWRSELCREDKRAQEWLIMHGGIWHPSNWYEKETFVEKGSLSCQYPLMRALFELDWCLTQFSGERFVPIENNQYPVEQVNRWIKKAKADPAKYWVRVVK